MSNYEVTTGSDDLGGTYESRPTVSTHYNLHRAAQEAHRLRNRAPSIRRIHDGAVALWHDDPREGVRWLDQDGNLID